MMPNSSMRAPTSSFVMIVPLYYCSAVACKTRAFETTFWPGRMPATISDRNDAELFDACADFFFRHDCSTVLLFRSGLQDQSVRDHFLARPDAGHDLLQVAGQHLPAGHFQAPELPAIRRDIYPVAVMQM